MKFNEAGLKLLTHFEGCRLEAYQDTGGIWTIGYGCTHHVFPGMVITADQAEARLREDIEETARVVRTLLGNTDVSCNRFSALVSFAYNVGTGNFSKSTLLHSVKMRRWEDAAAEFMKWTKDNGRELAGLVARRHAEQALFNTVDA